MAVWATRLTVCRESRSLVAERSTGNLKDPGSNPTRGALLEMSKRTLTLINGNVMGISFYPRNQNSPITIKFRTFSDLSKLAMCPLKHEWPATYKVEAPLRVGFLEISRYSRHLSRAEPDVGCVYHHTIKR